MTTNPYAEAVKNAGNACIAARCDDHDPRPTDYAEVAVAAAVGPLLAPIRALHQPEQERFHPWRTTCTGDGEDWPCCTTKVLDQIEGARDE